MYNDSNNNKLNNTKYENLDASIATDAIFLLTFNATNGTHKKKREANMK